MTFQTYICKIPKRQSAVSVIQRTWRYCISQMRDIQRRKVMNENKNNNNEEKNDVSCTVLISNCFLFKQQAAGIIQRVWKTFLCRKETQRKQVLKVIFSFIYLFTFAFFLHFFGNINYK